MKTINIEKFENSSITEPISFELDNYTIFAGENNSGKTNLIKSIIKHKDLKDYKIIYIPAEHIQPQNKEASPSAKTNAFFKVLDSILKPIFDKGVLEDLVEKFNNSQDKNKFIEEINIILKDFGVDKKEFDIKINKDEFEKDLIIKITKAFVKDLYKTDIDEVDFENIGMGTQRLIVAALIRYYEEKEIDKNKEVLIIFEEPEVYLHPKWKESLYTSLYNLSEKGKMVLITTHDPYFIELGKNQTIYKVFRNPKKKDATDLKKVNNKKLLPQKSYSEVNYQIFGLPSESYFLEIYEEAKRKTEKLQSKNYMEYSEFDEEIFKKLKLTKDCDTDDKTKKITSVTRLRHNIAHCKKEMCNMDIKVATENMIDYLEKL